jgi:homoserine O-acetyltransferase/O-succinyltransferase
LTLSLAMDLFDLGGTADELKATFGACKCRWLILSFSSDWLFPPDQSRDIVNALLANHCRVTYSDVPSACGHDAFLLPNDFPVYGEMTRGFLENLASSSGSSAAVEDELHGPTSIFHQHRVDYDRIAELIPPGVSVLDLGCGSGGLLSGLTATDHRRLVGVELDVRRIISCVHRGLDVVQADLNKGLQAFGDGEFDYVILSQTLQAIYDVESALLEMIRVGRKCIVSIPNFAYQPLRRMLAEEGRAPKTPGVLHYEWFNTPNIRFFTIADFEDFCRDRHIQVHRRIALDTESASEVFDDPNLNADLAIFVISQQSAT